MLSIRQLMLSISTVQQALNPTRTLNEVRPLQKSLGLSVCLWVVLSDWANWIHSLPAGDHQEQRKASRVENVQFQSNRTHCSRHDGQSSCSFLLSRRLSLKPGQFKQHHLIQSHADLPKNNIHTGAFQMNLQKFTVELSRI